MDTANRQERQAHSRMTNSEVECMLFGPVPKYIRPHFQVGKYFIGCYTEVNLDAASSTGLYYKQTNSVTRVSERTIPTERPPLVGEVSANFCA
jgi:hypothetical protein